MWLTPQKLKEPYLITVPNDVSLEATTCDAETSSLNVSTQVEKLVPGPISDSEWQQLRAQRRATREQRKQEDIKWREKRLSIRSLECLAISHLLDCYLSHY